MPPIDLTDRVAIVTGAGRGIGLAITQSLLEAGAYVCANIRTRSEAVEQSMSMLQERWPGRLSVEEGSAEKPETVSRTTKAVFSQFKRLDILVNNAGILRDNVIGMISDAEMEAVFENNVMSAIRFTQAAARLMMRRNAGSIINLASIIGRFGNSGQLVYGASKAAIIGATLSAAKELAPKGIRVNAIAPGLIDTRMTEGLPTAARGKLTEQIGMGRVGTPDDIANVAMFLASDLSTYVTGQIIGVDGGLIL